LDSERKLFKLENQMTYCEIKIEQVSNEKWLAETEPPIGEWTGDFLVARLKDGSADNFVAPWDPREGDIMMAHMHVTDIENHQQAYFSSFGTEDPEIFQMGPNIAPCLNRAF
jgi:hypothetical protein